MRDLKQFELQATRQKSFYGKAIVTEYPNGCKELKSYNTIVCQIDAHGQIHRTWSGWSLTTGNHVADFCRLYGVENVASKKVWSALPVESPLMVALFGINPTLKTA